MKEDLKVRTRKLALRVLQFCSNLPRRPEIQVMARQLIRSGLCRSQLPIRMPGQVAARFIAKLGIVKEEADESMYWLELLGESGLVSEEKLQEKLLAEFNQIVAIMVASRKTARKN